MDEFRSFIALEIPASLQKDFSHLINRLKTVFTLPVRWVQPGNIHLTLKFMGNISSSTYDSLKMQLKTIFEGFEPVPLTFTGLGFFPNIHNPKVLWVGMELPEELSARVSLVEQLTRSLGVPPENRSFSPHLTLGRINGEGRSEDNHTMGKIISSVKCDLPSTMVSKYVTLFKSDLTRQGPIYSPLFRVELQKHR
jgi:RNA 2',3'-cyclic 3'-phosphodiesterase